MNLSKDSGGRLLVKLSQLLMKMMIQLSNTRHPQGLILSHLIEAKRIRCENFASKFQQSEHTECHKHINFMKDCEIYNLVL